jgi:hypothetical protein
MYTSGRQSELREVPLKSSKFSYISDLFNHKFVGDVANEVCGAKPMVFIPNLHGMNTKHVNR